MGTLNHFKFFKMKLNLVIFGAALGKECYENVFDEARLIERGEILGSGQILEGLYDFGSCVERDSSLLTEDFIRSNEEFIIGSKRAPGTEDGCVIEFYKRCLACVPVQQDHPFCKEDHPNYNPIACAIKLNICLIESLTGLGDFC